MDYCSSVLSGISGQLLQRLQSVFNAATRLVFSARKSEHITPLLRELHWLKVPERIQFRLCFSRIVALSARRRHTLLKPSTYCNCRRRLTSASSECFYVDAVIQSTRRTTLGDRAFPVTAARAWNECSSVVCSFCAIAAAVPPRSQDSTVSAIVLFTVVSSYVTDCNF